MSQRSNRDTFLSALLGFILAGAITAPPIIMERAARAERIEAHDASLGVDAFRLDRVQVAKFSALLRQEAREEAPRTD
ncbi:hypothetical protein J7348_04055 [Qipengyuania flava]|jgi:hypothetical protein|uniref:hypothetical protein n=1 Tax=Qipengyuania flava TaxID=192812 RepID=UPI001ADD10AB|nr:hypothetical protein [Qipengyuania flava]MBO9503790.1 hypothetical protein [Qipengyuania flava]